MDDREVAEFRERLSAALKAALKTRNSNAIAAFRSALSSIANAEAVPGATGRAAPPKIGAGAGDVARRQLSSDDVIQIVVGEIDERMSAAAEYDRLGRAADATALREQATILRTSLEGWRFPRSAQ